MPVSGEILILVLQSRRWWVLFLIPWRMEDCNSWIAILHFDIILNCYYIILLIVLLVLNRWISNELCSSKIDGSMITCQAAI